MCNEGLVFFNTKKQHNWSLHAYDIIKRIPFAFSMSVCHKCKMCRSNHAKTDVTDCTLIKAKHEPLQSKSDILLPLYVSLLHSEDTCMACLDKCITSQT